MKDQKTTNSVQERVRRNLGLIQNLPALSSVTQKVIELSDSPSVTGAQVAEIVEKDQAMVTAVLKIVNSPFYGLKKRVSSINHAVILLGFRTVRNVALSAGLVNTFDGPPGDPRFDRSEFWAHSVYTAAAARLVAGRMREIDADEAFLAGLLHDMGRIVFDHYFAKEFALSMDVAEKNQIEPIAAESAVFGMDHANVGKVIANKWNFPPHIADAIGTHHDPERALETSPLAVCIYIAPEVTRIALERIDAASEENTSEEPVEGVDPISILHPAVIEKLDWSGETVEEICTEMEVEIEKAQVFVAAMQG